MKKINLGISIFVTAWLLASPVSATEIPPDTLIDTTAQEVLVIIRQDKDIRSGNTGKILNLVEVKVLPHFNFTRMTRLSMGKNWNIATPEQQQELVKEFRILLVRTYSNALAGYRDHQIKVEPARVKPGDTDVTVKTQVMEEHGQVHVPIDYSMEYSADGWKVYDVTVAGVSLVTNYRGSFNTQIRDGGVAKLLKTLQEKNRGLEARDKENKTATK